MNDGRVSPSAWRGRGFEVAIPEGHLFAVDQRGTEPDATPVLVLHGFPSSSWDFADVVAGWKRRVVLFDFLGFGLSSKPAGAGYSIFEHAESAIAVARNAQLTRAHVWAHDMGTSVATELLARRERGDLPFAIESVTLMNGSVHVEMASLTLGQHLLRTPALGHLVARLGNKAFFTRQMKRLFAKPVSDAVISGMWDFIAEDNGHLLLPHTIRYVSERVRFKDRWIGALTRAGLSGLPVHIAWGERDPVALVAIADRLFRETPGATSTRWPLGHYPQLEDAALVSRDVLRFMDAVDSASARN